MNLLCQSQKVRDIVIIHCQGRIVVGAEVQSLLMEIEKFRLETKKFVLELAHVAYVDSGGLGALVRLLGTLRAARGDLKLCQLPPLLVQVFAATNLQGLFHTYETESEAIAAFSGRPQSAAEVSTALRPSVICVDSSSDLLAYLGAVLKRSNYEVYTAKLLSDATTLVRSTHPRLAICGPTTQESSLAFEKFRQAHAPMKILILPADFQVSEAGQAGSELVERIRALLRAP